MWYAVTFEARGAYSSVAKTVHVPGSSAKEAIMRACSDWPLPELRESIGTGMAVSIKATPSERPEGA